MKFRTMLLASAAVMFASQAFAAEDFTITFFTPAKGSFLSDTTIQTSRMKRDFGNQNEEISKNLEAAEEITYGVTDDLAVFAGIVNKFSYDKDAAYNNDHNFAYEVGAKYNVSHNKFLGQVEFAYQTFDPRSWWGKSAEGEGGRYETNRWAKALDGTVKLGYVFDCGLTPYTTFNMNGTIDRADRNQKYSWFFGAHKMFEKVSVDGGFRYDFDNEDEAWYAQAEANYFVKDNITVGLFGDYYLGGTGYHDVDYGYTGGVNAKVLF